MSEFSFLDRVNNCLPYFLRNHSRCTGGAYMPRDLPGEVADAKRAGPLFDGKRALVRKDWPHAEDHFERAIKELPVNTFPSVVLCEIFDQGEMALRLLRLGEKHLEPSVRLAGIKCDMANSHRRHYRRCHRERDRKLANAYAER
jgi:hypothetical protein